MQRQHTPQTPRRSQQQSQGSPVVQSVHHSSVTLEVSGSPVVQSVHRSSAILEVSGHGLPTTTTAGLTGSTASQGDQYWSAADEDFFRSDEFIQSSSSIHSPPNRYVTQSRSSNGKLAYVVFAGHDVGVFYNWPACSTATLGFSNKVFKGFSSYNEAHCVWRAFVNDNILPPDVLNTLHGKPLPLPPTMPEPNIGGLADFPSPTPLRPSQMLPSMSHTQSHTLSASPVDLKPAIQKMAGFSSKRRASDGEDFWVVLTGVRPGVYQGRKEGELALGPIASPTYLKTGSREEANQIFVDEYMGLRVARFV